MYYQDDDSKQKKNKSTFLKHSATFHNPWLQEDRSRYDGDNCPFYGFGCNPAMAYCPEHSPQKNVAHDSFTLENCSTNDEHVGEVTANSITPRNLYSLLECLRGGSNADTSSYSLENSVSSRGVSVAVYIGNIPKTTPVYLETHLKKLIESMQVHVTVRNVVDQGHKHYAFATFTSNAANAHYVLQSAIEKCNQTFFLGRPMLVRKNLKV